MCRHGGCGFLGSPVAAETGAKKPKSPGMASDLEAIITIINGDPIMYSYGKPIIPRTWELEELVYPMTIPLKQ